MSVIALKIQLMEQQSVPTTQPMPLGRPAQPQKQLSEAMMLLCWTAHKQRRSPL